MNDIKMSDILSLPDKRDALESKGFTVQVSEGAYDDWLVWIDNPHCCALCYEDKDVEAFALGLCDGQISDCGGHNSLDLADADAEFLYRCDTEEYYAMVQKSFTDVVGVERASDWLGSYDVIPGNERLHGVRGSVICFGS